MAYILTNFIQIDSGKEYLYNSITIVHNLNSILKYAVFLTYYSASLITTVC